MNLAGPLTAKLTAFTAGLAGLGVLIAGLSVTIILLSCIASPMAREWAANNKGDAAVVIFALVVLPLVPAFVTAVATG